MAEDAKLRDLFLRTCASFLDPRVSAKMRPVARNMVWIINYSLNKVRRAMGLDPVSKSLADIFMSLSHDLLDGEVRAGDLVFFARVAPAEVWSVEVVTRPPPTLKSIGVAGNKVLEIDTYQHTFHVPTQLHFRSTSKWFQMIPEVIRPRNSLTGFQTARTFYLTSGNNSELVQMVLEAEGYRRVGNQQSAGIVWTQLLKQVDFDVVREGKQLVNHVPKMNMLITTKKSFRHTTKQIQGFPAPVTYDLSDQFDYLTFIKATNISNTKWILKPFALNQGIGISLITNVNKYRQDLQTGKETRQKVIQLYITNPLLLDGHKFDIRFYVLVVRCKPVVVLWYDEFYIRRSLNPYNVNSENLLTHLTNAHQQKAHPDFNKMKEESILSKKKLEEKLGSAVVSNIERGIIETLAKLMNYVCPRVEPRLGSFELLGMDFMLDSSMRLYMLEANVNPALYTDTLVLQTVIPKMVADTVAVVTKAHAGFPNYLENTSYHPLYPLT